VPVEPMRPAGHRSGLALAVVLVFALEGSTMQGIAAQQRILPVKHKVHRLAPSLLPAGQFIIRPVSG
jgi:hypothetical protein